jgi:hypothetical protein
MDAQVECFSSSAYARQPLAFTWQDRRWVIAAILDEKRTPDGKQFTVRVAGEWLFDLQYSEASDTWRIIER